MELWTLYVSFASILFMTVSSACGSKILLHAVAGHGSHFFVTTAIARELDKRGHNITVLVDDKYKEKIKANEKLQFIKFEFYRANFSAAEMDYFLSGATNAALRGEYRTWAMKTMMGSNYTERQLSECHNLLGDVELIEKLRKAEFDLTIVVNAYICPIMQYLGRPHVVMTPSAGIGSTSSIASRSPFSPSYMPEVLTAFDHRMCFSERLKNTIYTILFNVVAAAYVGPYDAIKHQYNIPDASLSFNDAEMWLINTNFAFDFPRPLLPNTVAVGGLTTRPAQPLNEEWEEFLQSAGDHGVVLFSMGSYVQGLDEDIAAIFAGAFAQLPQKVIWKLHGKPAATLTPNVKLVEWMPHNLNDLLGHPQVKVLVYHCGINGVYEALYHGVPVVALPILSDQSDTAQRIVSRGMGLKVDVATLTSDELANTIREVIQNPSYKRTVSHLSAIFRDTPRTPLELTGDTVEFVLRHGGKHLRSAALDLSVFQYLLLDVISVLLAAFVTLVVISMCCCKLCFKGCRKIYGSSGKVKSE